MKNTFKIALLFLLGLNGSYAQEFQGMAVYESKTSLGDFSSRIESKEITPEMQKMLEERLKKMMEKTFILYFDKTASIYKEEEKLDAPGQSSGFRMASSMMGGGGTQYKNIKEKTTVSEKEFFGKEFLIKDSLTKIDWKMTGETKKIGDYTCYKATAVKPADMTDFRSFRPKKEEKTNSQSNSKENTKTTNFLDQVEMPKEIEMTAWYTPEIPINQGPENYWGLPGLIMEVSMGKTIILCSKVVLNSKDKKEIKAPTKGKVVTQKEYNEIIIKKMEEMGQMGSGNNRNMQLRIGG